MVLLCIPGSLCQSAKAAEFLMKMALGTGLDTIVSCVVLQMKICPSDRDETFRLACDPDAIPPALISATP